MRRADNLTTFMCRLSLKLGASDSWNPQGLSRPVMGLLYLLLSLFATYDIMLSSSLLHYPLLIYNPFYSSSHLYAHSLSSSLCYTTTIFSKLCLTLRRLMSYIYIYIYIYMEHPFLMFLDHTQRRSTVGRTPLDE